MDHPRAGHDPAPVRPPLTAARRRVGRGSCAVPPVRTLDAVDLPGVNDDGLADPAVVAVLAAWAADRTPATRAAALTTLAAARVFAAVTARSTAEHVDPGTGLRAESTAEMALVTLAGSSGRGVPVFLDVPSLLGFDDGARPVRLSLPEACTAALEDGAVAVLVDPPGAALVLAGPELAELARGRVPVPGAPLSARSSGAALTTPADADPELLRRLTEALRNEPVQQARLLDGPDGPVLGVVPDPPLDPAGLAALASRITPRLDRPLDLAVVPPQGPGLPVPTRRRWLRRGR